MRPGAATVAAALAAAALAALAAHAAAKPQVEHVVVLMLENRSFDHMLGFLAANKSLGINGCYAGRPGCTNPLDPTDPASPLVPYTDDAVYVQVSDPHHSFEATTAQVYGGRQAVPGHDDDPPMSGFIANYENGSLIMSCFAPEHVPAMTTLATEFAVLDAWHSAIPGPTEVNRLMTMSATSHGSAANDKLRLALGYPQRTVFEQLDDSSFNRTWGVFFELFPTALFLDYPRQPKNWKKLHTMETFRKKAAAGDLPSFSFLEPQYYDITELFPANDMHPDHDVAAGDKLVADVYEAVRSGPKWNSTLLLVVYDEHGGFPDSVKPPATGVPSPDGIVADDVQPPFDFDRLGVRVPAIAVSPLIRRNTVVSSLHSHSSIPATVRELLTPDQAPLTARDAWAKPFGAAVLNLDEPRTDCPASVPHASSHRGVTPGLLEGDAIGSRPLHEFQQSIVSAAAGLRGVDRPPRGITEREAARFCSGELARLVRRPLADTAAMFGPGPL